VCVSHSRRSLPPWSSRAVQSSQTTTRAAALFNFFFFFLLGSRGNNHNKTFFFMIRPDEYFVRVCVHIKAKEKYHQLGALDKSPDRSICLADVSGHVDRMGKTGNGFLLVVFSCHTRARRKWRGINRIGRHLCRSKSNGICDSRGSLLSALRAEWFHFLCFFFL